MSFDVTTEQADGQRALALSGLQVRVARGASIVEEVDLVLERGEILGLVGESGSGKTTTALALLGYSADGAEICAGTLTIAGDPVRMDESMRPLRGSLISYIPQDPGRALNPSLRVGAAIEDIVNAHKRGRDTNDIVERMLETVELPSSHARRFPHQLSGGQQQRVSIALALSCDPAVVVLDEPTTGLDVVTQARVLAALLRLRDEKRIAMVYVTHDLAVVAQVADTIAVMYAGRIVERGRADIVLRRPRHPYTRGLIASIPDHARPRILEPMPGIAVGVGERPSGCAFAPRCPQRTADCDAAMPALKQITPTHDVRCIHWDDTPPVTSRDRPFEFGSATTQSAVLDVQGLRAVHHSHRETVVAAADVSFAVARGSCIALVGESGSGKTTIARAIAGLHPISAGRILLGDEEHPSRARSRTREQRRRIQLVFQNPAEALNPRHTVFETVARPARLLSGMDRRAAPAEVDRLLECVRLPARLASRYPAELSGGERQRVAIARALAAGPDLIVCDEITSALDVSVQAAVLKLLADLQTELGLGLLFITHDLGVVATIADEVLVLEHGILCERGHTAKVLGAPAHPYTQRLLAAAPSIAHAVEQWDARDT